MEVSGVEWSGVECSLYLTADALLNEELAHIEVRAAVALTIIVVVLKSPWPFLEFGFFRTRFPTRRPCDSLLVSCVHRGYCLPVRESARHSLAPRAMSLSLVLADVRIVDSVRICAPMSRPLGPLASRTCRRRPVRPAS